jgi:uncharacterized integral membrane protein
MWLKIRIWTKMIVISAIGLYALLFIFINMGQNVRFWFWFGREPETPLLLLVVFAFLFGALLTMIVRTVLKTVGQIRTVKERNRAEQQQRELNELKSKAAGLNTVERPHGGVDRRNWSPKPEKTEEGGA